MKTQIEASCDAVFAIVLTILVLEFKTPDVLDIRLILDHWEIF